MTVLLLSLLLSATSPSSATGQVSLRDLPYSRIPFAHVLLAALSSVDEAGWQYGDNHFEKMGPKGGLGKYTRRRAWVRRAGLVERCERVSGGDAEKPSLGSASLGGLGTAGVGVGVGLGTHANGRLRERSESGGRSKERSREKSGDGEKDSLRRRKSTNASKGKELDVQ